MGHVREPCLRFMATAWDQGATQGQAGTGTATSPGRHSPEPADNPGQAGTEAAALPCLRPFLGPRPGPSREPRGQWRRKPGPGLCWHFDRGGRRATAREKVVAAASLFPRGMARETLSEKGKTPVHSVGKARAHALRARAEQPASPRATASGRPRPLVRDYRRPRRAAARAGPPSAQGSYRTAHPPLPRGVRSAILINNQYYEMRFTI